MISDKIGIRFAISKAGTATYDNSEDKKASYYDNSYRFPYGEYQVDFAFLHRYTP